MNRRLAAWFWLSEKQLERNEDEGRLVATESIASVSSGFVQGNRVGAVRAIRHGAWMILLMAPLALGSFMFGQAPPGQVAAKMAENNAELKRYIHMRKIEVYWRAKLRSTRFAEVTVDAATGKEIVVPLGSEGGAQSQAQPTGFVMGQVEKKIAGRIKQEAEQLRDLMGQYLPLKPEALVAAPGPNGEITFHDYAQPGDTMSISVNPDTNAFSRIAIGSSIDGTPVSYTVDFASLPNGLTYPAETKMKWDAKRLELDITNFEYHH